MSRTSNITRVFWVLTTLYAATGLPAKSLAGVVVEPSTTLTQESVRLERDEHLHYAYQLRTGTELVFDLKMSRWRRDPPNVLLLDQINYQNWLSDRPFSYYEPGGEFPERGTHFEFLVPRSGMYHVIVDNSDSRSQKNLAIYAYANTPRPSESDRQARRVYESFYDELRALLEFEDLDIFVTRCGNVNAYSTPNIVICKEFDELLESSPTEGLRLFVLMHEVAHSFLYFWGYQSIYTNQFMTDRLAATLIELMDREELATEAAQWFAANESITDPSSPHAPFEMPRYRAQRIASWLSDDEQLDLGWTKRIIFPKMHTSALESMMQRQELERRTRFRIESELTKRSEEAAE